MKTKRTAITAMTAALFLGGCADDVPSEVSESGIDLSGSSSGDEGVDGSADSGSGTANADGPGECGASTFMLEHQPTNVVLVLDKSYSMVANTWDHDSDGSTPEITRWNSLHNSVSFIVGDFDEGLNFGAVLFPSVDVPDNEWETACQVSSEPDATVAPSNGDAVLAALPAADDVDLFGGTPASRGITTSLEHLRSLDPELPRALILVTDGAANCLEGTTDGAVFNLYDANLPGLVAEAYNDEGIPTFVVGIDIVDGIADYPQDNPYERLNEVAIAGGFPQPGQEKFHNASDEDELSAAISQITSQIGCTVPLEPIPEQPELLSIVIGDDEIPMVDSCEGVDVGWAYTNPAGPFDEIELCGDACTSLHNSGTLAAHYECIPIG